MPCPKCKSEKYISTGGIGSTLAYYSTFTDEKGKEHHHDKNYKHESVKCSECDTYYKIRYYTKCWCGWSSEFPDKTFHKSEKYPEFKGFGIKAAIINDKWIDNLKM